MKSTYHIFLQFGIFLLSYFVVFLDRDLTKLRDEQIIFFLISSICIWLFVIWLTHTHKPKLYQKKLKYISSPYWKSIFLTFLLNYILVQILIEDINMAEKLYFTFSLYSILFISIYFFLWIAFFKENKNSSITKNDSIKKYVQNNLIIDSPSNYFSLNEYLLNDLHYFNKKAVNQLVGNDNLDSSSLSHIYSKNKMINFLEEKKDICLVDTRINDIKGMDVSLQNLYKSILPGGYLLLVYEDLVDFEKKFINSFSSFIKIIKKAVYYIYFRGFPKIPIVNKLYILISGDKNRVISKAEVWGRLFYNGFIVRKQINIDGLSYILARKEIERSTNPNPSFYPIITLDRVGLFGKIIKIHKVRSMYPYSEFLQKRIFEDNNLSTLGKFENDFRISSLGRFYRKYWIDEIPQIIDWFRGELKLVGIRAMSQHFFSLYPSYYQEMYFKVKPGLVPPLFDEKTSGFEDIVAIESDYLKSYLNQPFLTDIKYLWFALEKIFLKGLRSK